EWAALLSTKGNAVRIILEVIWSKISIYFDVAMPWGEDSDTETAVPLLFAKPLETETSAGWYYSPIRLKESQLNSRESMQEWQPVEISKDITSVIYSMLATGGYIDLDSIDEIASSHSVSFDELFKRLMNTLLFKQVGDYVRPISSRL
ncbi:hypothetical protein CGI90_26290, partial [Vibrio parahaemolyticus]|uniref:hypothetical protein n=1 Tax=Vibrio parahaemolyticus TaxID=670 RepID=UPI001166DC2F